MTGVEQQGCTEEYSGAVFKFDTQSRGWVDLVTDTIISEKYSVRIISAIIVTDDYLCYKEPKSPNNFFLILIVNELFKFKTSDEWQH